MLRRPVALTLAKSAILESMLTTAAHPPSLSRPDIRNSLNQTSPQAFVPVDPEFLRPTIKTLISPKLGFPFIATRCWPVGKGENSETGISLSWPSTTS